MNKKNKNNQLTFYLILALSAIFILIAFYYEGRATERFGEGHDEHLKSFKDAVENAIPPQVGVWFSDFIIEDFASRFGEQSSIHLCRNQLTC